MLTPLKALSLVFVTTSNMSELICNRFHDRQGNSSKKPLFTGVPLFDARLAGLLEPSRSALRLLKFAFNAKNFVRELSWSISSHFVAIYS